MEQFLSRLMQYLVALPDIMEAALSSCGLTNTLPLQCLHHTNTKKHKYTSYGGRPTMRTFKFQTHCNVFPNRNGRIYLKRNE